MLDTNFNLLATLGSAVAPPQGTISAAGGADQPRFDLLLLELTKAASVTGKAKEDALVPERVKAALADLLIPLATQGTPEVEALLNSPVAIKDMVSQVAREHGLQDNEKELLNKLFTAVLQRVIEPPQTVPTVQQKTSNTGNADQRVSPEDAGPKGRIPGDTQELVPTVSKGNIQKISQNAVVQPQARVVQLASNGNPEVTASAQTQVAVPQSAPQPTIPPVAVSVTELANSQPVVIVSARTLDPTSAPVSQANNPAGKQAQAPVHSGTQAGNGAFADTQQPALRQFLGQSQETATISQVVLPATEGTQSASQQAQVPAPVANAAQTTAPSPIVISTSPQARNVPAPPAPVTQVQAQPNTPQPKVEVQLQQVENVPSQAAVVVPDAGKETSAPKASSPPAPAVPQAQTGENTPQALPGPRPQVTVLNQSPQPQVDPSTEVVIKGGEQPAVAVQHTQNGTPQSFVNITQAPAQPAVQPQAQPQVEAKVTAETQVPTAPAAVQTNTVPSQSTEQQSVEASSGKDEKAKFSPFSQVQTSEPKASDFNPKTLSSLADSVVKDYQLRETVLKQVEAQLGKLEKGISQLRIELQPKELGKLEVQLMSHEGRLVARIMVSNSEVKEVIAANLQSFKESLEMRGIHVQEVSVALRSDVGKQNQNFEDRSWMYQQKSSQSFTGNNESPQPQAWASERLFSQDRASFSVLA